MTKAELEALYPNRMVRDSRNSDGTNQHYFVEPPGVTTGTNVARDRLVLVVSDGKLATFDVMHSDEEVMGATEISASLIPHAPKAAPPPGKYGVQIGSRRSEAEARALIDEMHAKYPVLLGQQWAAIHHISLPQGEFFRVVIGPLGSPQQAQKLCDSLKAQGTECFLQKT